MNNTRKPKRKPKPRQVTPPPDTVATVGDYFATMAGDDWTQRRFLSWPPDAFCLMAFLLQRTGAYVRLVKKWPPKENRADWWITARTNQAEPDVKVWAREMRRRGRAWWRHVNANYERKLRSTPAAWGKQMLDPEIVRNWQTIRKHRNTPLSELTEVKTPDPHGRFWQAVFEIMASADEACEGIGGVFPGPHLTKAHRDKERQDFFIPDAGLSLQAPREHGSATLCRAIDPMFGIVLPKMHTPQSGITLRSISHNLAYVRPTEVRVTYENVMTKGFFTESPEKAHAINVLFVPWPDKVRPNDFATVKCQHQSTEDRFGFFTFNPQRRHLTDRTRELGLMLETAQSLVGRIDGVLMPELALAESEIEDVAKTIQDKSPSSFLIAGVGSVSTVEGEFGSNKAFFSAGRFVEPRDQAKHHRWQLEQRQIDQYGLGSNLDPQRVWWEHIPIENRQMRVMPVGERITMSVLICEDLARQDPIADVIRCIGPNLVVALLMDGPQLNGRWPAHYATVFADDPGSSVLTVTSIGMSHLCRPKGRPVSRVVGLWKDRFDGFREIELPQGDNALVLTLTLEDHEEWTADGRRDRGRSTYVRLNGIHPITLKGDKT